MMISEEIISVKAERKLAYLLRDISPLSRRKELENKILLWAKELLGESRLEWNEMRKITIAAIVSADRKTEAVKRGSARDKRYAPFREYFKQIQYKRWQNYQKAGKELSARGFVIWFMKKKADIVNIPYKKSNLENKLNQLAQANNREFKKAFANYGGMVADYGG